jgi:hypothetical protein
MLLLPNWEQSAGANLEVGWARHIGLAILGPFDLPEEIPAPRRWIL